MSQNEPVQSHRTQFLTLFFIILLSWSMTVVLGPMVSIIAKDFGLTNETNIGNISAAFLLVGGLFAFVWVALENHVAQRWQSSRKKLLMIATFLAALGLLLTGVARSFELLFTFQMLTAIGFAAITPLSYSLAMDFTTPENRAKTFGLLDVAASIGVGFGFLLSGILVDFTIWNIPFVILGMCGLFLVQAFLEFKEPPKGASQVKTDRYQFTLTRGSFSLMLKKRANALIVLFNILLYMISGSISYYFIRMLVNDHGFAPSLATLFFLATFSSQVAGTIFWTRRADKQYARKRNGKIRVLLEGLLLGPIFLIAAYSLTFTISNGVLFGIFTILVILGTFCIAGLIAISFATLGEINPPELWAPIFSVNNLAQTVGRGIGIAVMGILFTSYGGVYQWGFAVMEGLSFIAVLFILPLFTIVPHEANTLAILLNRRRIPINPQATLPDRLL